MNLLSVTFFPWGYFCWNNVSWVKKKKKRRRRSVLFWPQNLVAFLFQPIGLNLINQRQESVVGSWTVLATGSFFWNTSQQTHKIKRQHFTDCFLELEEHSCIYLDNNASNRSINRCSGFTNSLRKRVCVHFLFFWNRPSFCTREVLSKCYCSKGSENWMPLLGFQLVQW